MRRTPSFLMCAFVGSPGVPPGCGKKLKVKPGSTGKQKVPMSAVAATRGGYLRPVKGSAAPRRRWWLIAVGAAALALTAGLAATAMIFWSGAALERKEIPYESQLREAAAKVRSLETDTIDVRTLAGINDQDIGVLHDLPNLRRLILDHAAITDTGMKYVARNPSITVLSLTHTQVTDAGLAELKNLIGLEELRLDHVGITDAGLAHLQEFPRLRWLSLYQTPVTNAGLARLKPLFFLEHLSLDQTSVTDAGLPQLSELPRLRYLSVWDTRVTDVGIATLKQNMPSLKVNH